MTLSKNIIDQEVLKSSELESILENSPTGLAKTDLDGKIVFVSKKTKELFGLIGNQAIGQNIINYLHPDGHETFTAGINRILSNGTSLKSNIRAIHPSKSEFYVEGIASLVKDLANNPSHFVISFNDISKRIIATNKLAASEEKYKKLQDQKLNTLETKNKELQKYIKYNLQLENFAYIASHDLKAPLRTVTSFSELLKEKIYSSLDPKNKNYLDIVISSSQQMQIIIDDLLVFSSVSTEILNITEVKMSYVFDRILLNIGHVIEGENTSIKIKNKIDSVPGDEKQLERLFKCVVDNSIRFAHQDRPLEILIDSKETANDYQFSVSDNGIGIRQENLEKIFDVFVKLHSNDIFPGTGLGLTIAKKITANHNGNIVAHSEMGKGTKILITLPKTIH